MDPTVASLLSVCRSDLNDITFRQFALLVYLGRLDDSDERSIYQNLARDLAMSKAAMTRAVAKLEEAGMIKRQALPTDQRQFHVVLTPTGAGFLAAHGLQPEPPAVARSYVLVVDPSTRACQLVGPFPDEEQAGRLAARSALPGEQRHLVVSTGAVPVWPAADEQKRLRAQRRLLPAAA